MATRLAAEANITVGNAVFERVHHTVVVLPSAAEIALECAIVTVRVATHTVHRGAGVCGALRSPTLRRVDNLVVCSCQLEEHRQRRVVDVVAVRQESVQCSDDQRAELAIFKELLPPKVDGRDGIIRLCHDKRTERPQRSRRQCELLVGER
jgi:hypothetical protein